MIKMRSHLLAYDKYQDIRNSVQAGLGLGSTTNDANNAGCPMLADGSCNYGGMNISCGLIRECDPFTGNVHFEYTLPGGSNNVNIASYGIGSGTLDLSKTTQQQASYYSSPGVVAAINNYEATGQIPNTNSASQNQTSTTSTTSNTINANTGSTGTGSNNSNNSPNGSNILPTGLFENIPSWALIAGIGLGVLVISKVLR